jgi:uncharacterized membrane protein HdeD (DUF308 family)
MPTKRRRLPLSPVNLILAVAFLISAIIATAVQLWLQGGLLLALAILVVVQARRARRANSTDTARITALEYRDERDRILARLGFSVVGAVALIAAVVEFIAALIVVSLNRHEGWAQAIYWFAFVQYMVFTGIWGRANRSAVYEN